MLAVRETLRHVLLTPSHPESSTISADQLHKMSRPAASVSQCFPAEGGSAGATARTGAPGHSSIADRGHDREATDEGSFKLDNNVGAALLLNQTFRHSRLEQVPRACVRVSWVSGARVCALCVPCVCLSSS